MNTFNKKSLYAAVAGLSALGVTGAAQAVSVNPDGLGQALVYPYYTVRDQVAGSPYNSLLSVVNSTASAKAVKVRFLEGKNSREVLDFNLYLSPKDVWTAAIIPTADGGGIFTADKSCTTPTVSSSATAPTTFVNFAFSGSNDDGAGTSLDRTREGYVEIIEMGNVTGATAAAVTHSSGVPSCSPLSNASADTVTGNGGLFGGMTLINVLQGTDYTEDAVALDAFSATALWNPPGSILPNLANVNPKISVVTTGTSTYITDWSLSGNPADPVSAVLMHNNVYNEFVLDAATKSGTDWVITMPTKNFYYTGTTVTKLFQRNFTSTGACDDVGITQYDREERTVVSQTQFSPPPPTQTDSICWEANVITFNSSNVLGSKNLANVPSTFQNGWMALNFNGSSVPATRHTLVGGASTVFNIGTGTTTSLGVTTFNGLPVVGFAVQSFNNGTLTANGAQELSSYGGNFVHKTTRSIQ
ncbi:MAG TPA: hypothetical protein VLR71_16770 [Casimicrobiaceae bacterium]|nr:hypothetical protein [Casimicrobiaceae bacterium]